MNLLLNLVIGKDIADNCLDTNIFSNGRGHHAEIVDEFFELFPRLALGEDWLHESDVLAGADAC